MQESFDEESTWLRARTNPELSAWTRRGRRQEERAGSANAADRAAMATESTEEGE